MKQTNLLTGDVYLPMRPDFSILPPTDNFRVLLICPLVDHPISFTVEENQSQATFKVSLRDMEYEAFAEAVKGP